MKEISGIYVLDIEKTGRKFVVLSYDLYKETQVLEYKDSFNDITKNINVINTEKTILAFYFQGLIIQVTVNNIVMVNHEGELKNTLKLGVPIIAAVLCSTNRFLLTLNEKGILSCYEINYAYSSFNDKSFMVTPLNNNPNVFCIIFS